jgi:hypothetical protein
MRRASVLDRGNTKYGWLSVTTYYDTKNAEACNGVCMKYHFKYSTLLGIISLPFGFLHTYDSLVQPSLAQEYSELSHLTSR